MTRHADRDRSGAYWPPAAAAAYDEPVPYVPTEPDAPDIWAEVRGERERAHAKHGEKSMESWPTDNHLRLTILLEEVGEVAREFNEAALSDRPVDLEALRSELIQVAAMAGAWADACPVPERLDAKDAEIAELPATRSAKATSSASQPPTAPTTKASPTAHPNTARSGSEIPVPAKHVTKVSNAW